MLEQNRHLEQSQNPELNQLLERSQPPEPNQRPERNHWTIRYKQSSVLLADTF
jgi:hypothetical protein